MKLIEFTKPEGFMVPEGTKAGDDFEALATIRVKSDGKLCLIELDGHKLPGYKEGDRPENLENSDYVKEASARMESEGGGYA